MGAEQGSGDPIVKAGVELLRRYYHAIARRDRAEFLSALTAFRALDKSSPDEMDKAREIYFGF